MQNTVDDLYYGNITPGKRQITPDSELRRAVDRAARFESQLTERLDETGRGDGSGQQQENLWDKERRIPTVSIGSEFSRGQTRSKIYTAIFKKHIEIY